MKPHSLRRVLWLTNLALAVAVVGVLAWFVMKIRPAVAKDTGRAVNFQPKRYEDMRKDYESLRMTGLKWTPEAPVGDKELHDVVLRPDYAKRNPAHWIFSGPMPPPLVTETGPKETGPPPPKGLDAMGKVALVILNPPDNDTVLFKFNGGKSDGFGEGDFVRASAKEPGRFKITEITEKEPGSSVYVIKYAVFGKDPDKPESEAELIYDQSARTRYGFLRPTEEPAPTDAPADAADGTGTGTASTGGAGTKPGEGAGGDAAGNAGTREPVRVIKYTPDAELTLTDLKPTITKVDSSRRVVEFDDNSHRYFRGKNAKILSEGVKTAPAVDKQTGRKIGLRITGWEKDAPADVFDVRRGDILISINGQRVTSRSDAVRIVEKLSPENLVTIVIERNTRQITYKVDPRDPKNKRKVRYFQNLR